MRMLATSRFLPVVLLLAITSSCFGWGHKGHEMINKIAAEKLPADVPAFLHSKKAIDQMEFQGPEPDHWYSKTEPELNATQSPEHFINMEYADLVANPLPRKRFDYLRALTAAQPLHPEIKMTPENVGLQPYQATEVWQRLVISMRAYRTFTASHKNTDAIEALVIYYAGWLGHYVADGSQPLHLTYQYNGWVGPNPNGYPTDNKVHARFESDFVNANIAEQEIAALVPAKPLPHGDIFDDYMAYLRYSHSFVEKLYQLDKAGNFTGAGTPAGKAFELERLSAGATELRDLIYFAWTASAVPPPPAGK